ncbi:hypothetical protein BC834DRAFT_866981 [Gloeopeniophorella convolvens]|nr:hypothetical protein BC834DRAFT_866981 [Gloeopeniophorella convolvens]
MANILTVVPGSRRPISVDSTGVVVNITLKGTDLTSSSKIISSSSISRRKPQTTYRSPSLQFPGELRVERSAQSNRPSPPGHGPLSASTPASRHPSHTPPAPVTFVRPPSPRPKMNYSMKPPLPIYHPQGKLALSLPELDFGEHAQASTTPGDDGMRRSSSRARRPAAKLRDVVDGDGGDAGSPLVPPADTPLLPEKPSPRKRRGGGQSTSRRRRREPDDGDATYPAKRTRATRAPAVQASEGGSPAGVGGADAGDGDGAEEGVKAPERRSTRSRAAAQAKAPVVRRNSSASDGTQTSVSVSIAASRPRKDDTDVTPPAAAAPSSGSPGEAEAAPVAKAAQEESPTWAARAAAPEHAKAPEVHSGSKMDVDEEPLTRAQPRVPEASTPALPVAPTAPQKVREEGELSEEGELRSPSS